MAVRTIEPSRRDKSRPATASTGGSLGAAIFTPNEATPICTPAFVGWRESMIRRKAYFRSLHRTPCFGGELEDWLAAEQEVGELVACGGAPY